MNTSLCFLWIFASLFRGNIQQNLLGSQSVTLHSKNIFKTLLLFRVYMSRSYSNPSHVVNTVDRTPRFQFYLYNKQGRILKTQMSIHEVQKLLLRQTKHLGWSPFHDLIRRKLSFTPLLDKHETSRKFYAVSNKKLTDRQGVNSMKRSQKIPSGSNVLSSQSEKTFPSSTMIPSRLELCRCLNEKSNSSSSIL